MPNTTEQILLTLGARNQASSVFGQVDKDAQSMASSISSSIASINSGLMNIGSVTDNMMQGLTGKSALDNIIGTKSKAETNNVLLKNMLDDAENNFDSFYDTVDKTTDSSLTSMQELIPALKAFKSATAASDKDVEAITSDMANFGAAVLAQTGSTDLAQGAMMDLSKGIKGAFAALDQYGITEDSLKRNGWSGEEDDVKGYMEAVTKVTGSTDELMETNAGLDAQIGKAFSRAGKKMGNEFLPVLKDIKKGFLDLDDATGGNLTASILAVSGGVEVLNQGLWNVSTTVNGVRDLADGFKFLTENIKGATKAAEGASDAINTASNISDIGAGAASVGSIGGGATKTITGAENIALEGFGSWNAIDLITDSKKEQKATAEAEKQIGKLVDRKEKLLENIVDTDDEQLIKKFKKGVASTDSKLTTGDLDDGAIGALLQFNENTLENISHEDDGLSDAIRDSFSKKGQKITDAAEQGGESLQKGLKKMADVPSKMNKSFHSFTESFSESIHNFKDAGVKGNLKKLDQKLLSVFKGTEEISDALDVADDVGDMTKTVTGAEEIAEGMSGVSGAASTMAATGPELKAAAAGGAAVEAGATGLAATFTSIMVPLLAISAAIIIIIPIIAFIAAEAMVFIKMLGELMESMKFQDIDLKGAADGIKSITEALAWIGVAMGAMSFAGVMTGLAFITGGFLGMTTPLKVAIDSLTEAADLFKEFSTVSIDKSVPDNLKNISDSLVAVSTAMLALTATNITTGFSDFVAWVFGFSSNTDAIRKAKDDLIEASAAINELATGIEPLNEEDASKIQNVCDSLASVGAAMDALRSIRDGQNWDNIFGGLMEGLFGKGVDIKTALDNVKDDVADAAAALNDWELEEIPEGVGEKVKTVSDTLTSLTESFEALRKLRDDTNWDDFVGGIFGETDIQGALSNIKKELYYTANNLKGLEGMPAVSEGIGDKIKVITDTVSSVGDAVTGLTGISDMGDYDSANLSTAVTNVQNAATELSKLNDTAFNGESADGVLTSISTTIENLKTTLSSASGFSEPATNIGTEIVNGVKSGLSPLTSTITGEVSAATNGSASAGWTGGAYIGQSTTGGFKSALKLHDVMTTEMGYVKTAVDNGIREAKSAAENGAEEIVEAFKSGINVGSPGDIARAMKQEMIYTKDFILGSYSELKNSAYGAGRIIVDSFGNPNLELNKNSTDVQGLETLNSKVPVSQDNKTIVMYNNVTVDARNKTEKEAQSILTLALEGMDHITNIDMDV